MDEAGITVPVPLLRTRLEDAWHAGLHTLHRVCLHVGACVNEECVQRGRCEVGRSRVSRLVGRRVSAARAPSRAAVTGRAVWTRVSPSQSSGNERVQHGVQREPCFRSFILHSSEPSRTCAATSARLHGSPLTSDRAAARPTADARQRTVASRLPCRLPVRSALGTRPSRPTPAMHCPVSLPDAAVLTARGRAFPCTECVSLRAACASSRGYLCPSYPPLPALPQCSPSPRPSRLSHV